MFIIQLSIYYSVEIKDLPNQLVLLVPINSRDKTLMPTHHLSWGIGFYFMVLGLTLCSQKFIKQAKSIRNI